MKQVTPKQIYKRWLAALRSGKYKQATGEMRTCTQIYNAKKDEYEVKKVHGHCCLGVLEDLAVRDGGPAWDTKLGVSSDDSMPRKVILDFLGLDKDMVNHLIELNDAEGKSFEEIADVIEFEIMPATGN